MPRKPKSKPIAAAIEAAEQHQTDAIEAMCREMKPLTPEQIAEPFVPGDSFEGDLTATAADTHFSPPAGSFVRMTAKPEPVFGMSLDERQGIRIDVEKERKLGQVGPRVLIKFRNDMPPSGEEKAVLHAEGFRYESADKAWTAPKSAANVLLAKRAVNHITHDIRKDTGAALFV